MLSGTQLEQISDGIIGQVPPGDILDIISKFSPSTKYKKYRKDPVGFCEKHFDESYTDDVKKVMESVRDNRVTIAVSATGTGKSHCASRLAVWFYKCFEDCHVFTAAAPPIDNLEVILWGELGKMFDQYEDVFQGDIKKYLNISRPNGDFIKGQVIPAALDKTQIESKASGKHAEHQLFENDEADGMPDAFFVGQEGCMSGPDEHQLLMLNPRRKAGYAFRLTQDPMAANVIHLSAFNHPNVITGEAIIPGGCVSRKQTVVRIHKWCRPLAPNETPDPEDTEFFKLPKFLEGVVVKSDSGKEYPPLVAGWYKIIESAFSYIVLGQFPAQESDQLISQEWVDRARSRWDSYVAKFGEKPPHGTQGIGGLDAAEMGNDANVLTFRWGGWVEMPITWGKVDMMVTGDNAARYCRERGPRGGVRLIGVDATGVGAGVAPHMRRNQINAHSIKVAEKPTKKCELGNFAQLCDQLLWAVREWLRVDPGAMLPPCLPLLEELVVPTYEINKQKKIKVMSSDVMKDLLGGRSPDYLKSLTMCFCDQVELPKTKAKHSLPPPKKKRYPWN